MALRRIDDPAWGTPAADDVTTTRQLRSLNVPRGIQVAGRRPDGHPAAIIEGRTARRITAVTDEWWVEDEWWRAPISRHYLEVQLVDGTIRTIYHDTVADTWHKQAY
ncbi:MAG TPA: hypothetical protein VGT61_02945 [Thermomicrobiales bacterium]|jgi:hypothetical protein|nr:hypothetical protein [Thermomicrobiales bacterium]